MSVSKLMNHKEIGKNILNIFEEVVDLKNYSFPKNDNLYYKMLEHIKKIKNKPYISLNNLSMEDISFFMQILLDAFSMCAATGSKGDNLSSLKINNLKLLGSLKERRSKLLKIIDNQKIKDWLSCVLLQGWFNSNKEYPNLNVFDLEHDKRFKNSKKCDFKIDFDNKNFELIECKRIHPEKEASFSEMIYKINDTINYAVEQIKETERILAVESVCRTIFLNVTSYNNNFLNIDKNMKTTGFNGQEIIEIVKNIFVNLKDDGINSKVDRIILTWKNIVFFDDIPIALFQNYHPIIGRPDILKFIDYEGWTIGLYTSNTIFELITVSSTVRTLALIKAMCLNAKDQLLTYGKEETKKSNY